MCWPTRLAFSVYLTSRVYSQYILVNVFSIIVNDWNSIFLFVDSLQTEWQRDPRNSVRVVSIVFVLW